MLLQGLDGGRQDRDQRSPEFRFLFFGGRRLAKELAGAFRFGNGGDDGQTGHIVFAFSLDRKGKLLPIPAFGAQPEGAVETVGPLLDFFRRPAFRVGQIVGKGQLTPLKGIGEPIVDPEQIVEARLRLVFRFELRKLLPENRRQPFTRDNHLGRNGQAVEIAEYFRQTEDVASLFFCKSEQLVEFVAFFC